VHRVRSSLPGEGGQLALGRSAADDEVAAALPQRGAQLPQGLEQEPRAGLGREPPAQQPLVEHERRDDAVGAPRGGGQRRVVVDAQVAPKPDDRRVRHLSQYGAEKRGGHT
jgi:hypothetical protein